MRRWGTLSMLVGAHWMAACAPTGSEPSRAATAGGPTPIIDAHFHHYPDGAGRPAFSDQIAALRAAGVDHVAVHYIRTDAYEAADIYGDMILRGVSLPCWKDERGSPFMCEWGETGFPDIDWLRAEARAGRLTHLGEMGFLYAGIDPADPRMMPYWDLAAAFDLPAMVHVNRGPPADNPMRSRMRCCPNFDADKGNPDLLRPVLARHPDLRIVLQHYGFPALPQFDGIGYVEESIALMKDYPGVMADMSTFHSVPFISEESHAAAVRRLKDEGLLDRLVFATDTWPAAPAIARYEAMEFLDPADRRAIIHDNAARLFGLDQK